MARVYRLVYREVVKAVGGDAAYLLAELIACEQFAEKNNKTAGGWFSVTEKSIEEFTGFGRWKQGHLLQKLIDGGFIEKKNDNGRGQMFRILPANPCENQQGTRAKTNRVPVQKPTGYPCENQQGTRAKNNRVFIYMNSFMNSFLISCCDNDKQRIIIEKVFLYFCSKIPDEKKACDEAAAFIQYNRENYGEEHITGRNYKKHADVWINNINNKPKKKSKGRSGKTAAEAAKAQGVTVGEFLNIEPLPVNAEKIAENTPDIFGELFGGEK